MDTERSYAVSVSETVRGRHYCLRNLHQERFMMLIVGGVDRTTLLFYISHQTSVADDLTDAQFQ